MVQHGYGRSHATQSRRFLLQALLLAASGGARADRPPETASGEAGKVGPAPHKFSKQLAGYRDRGHGGPETCGMCHYFLDPDQCVLVDGPVNQANRKLLGRGRGAGKRLPGWRGAQCRGDVGVVRYMRHSARRLGGMARARVSTHLATLPNAAHNAADAAPSTTKMRCVAYLSPTAMAFL